MTLPRQPTNVTVLIQNISKNTLSNSPHNPDNISYLENNWKLSKKISELFIGQKLKYESKEKIGFLYMGSALSYSDSYGDFQDIEKILPIDIVSFHTLKTIYDKEEKDLQNVPTANLLDALTAASFMIKEVNGKVNKRIIIITDDSISDYSDVEFSEICKDLQLSNIKVNILGIGKYSSNDFDETEIYKKLKKLSEETEGEFVSGEYAVELYSELTNKTKGLTTTFRGVFEIGETLGIPMWIFKLTEKATLPTAKQRSLLIENESSNSGKIKRITEYRNPSNREEIIDETNIIKGYKYGKNIIPFTTNDEEILKYSSKKGFKLLGFTHQSQVPRHHFMSEAYICIPPFNDETASVAFSVLVKAMTTDNTLAIVRYQRTDNSDPQLALLYPYYKKKYDCLLMVQLPFYEDQRRFPFRSFSKIEHTAEQLQTMEEIIDKMNLYAEDYELFNPSNTFNATFHYLYQSIHDRSLNNSINLPDIDPIISESCLPDTIPGNPAYEIQKSIKELSQKCKSLFDLQVVEENEKKKRKYWFAIEENSIPSQDVQIIENGIMIPRKRRKIDDGLDNNNDLFDNDIDDTVRRSIFDRLPSNIGTSDPVKNFKDMLSRTDKDLTETAIDQMIKIIFTLLESSIGDQLFSKAESCIEVLREGCIKEQESTKYNEFLQKLKSFLQTKNIGFLELIKKRFSLISKEEAEDSEVTIEEVNSFWNVAASSTINPSEDIDRDNDIFDEID